MIIFAQCSLTLFTQCAYAAVIHNKPSSVNDEFNITLLAFILHKADPTIKLEAAPESYSDGRAQAELERNNLSVIWRVTSIDLEEKFLPVRYCAFKGLLGYRIFIIRPEDQYKFDHVRNLDDLKELKAGQGSTWSDTAILRAAGIPVITTTKYRNLFPMLDGNRFDYFPRGIFEPWNELPSWPQYRFSVEKHVLIHYPSAFYFFVNKSNKALADTIAKGFELSIADGSYDEFFYSSHVIADAITLSELSHRTIIELENPTLPAETPLARRELWYDAEKAGAVLAKVGNRKHF